MSFFSSKKNSTTITVAVVTSSKVFVALVKQFDKKTPQKPIVLFSQEYPIFFRGSTKEQIIHQVAIHLEQGLNHCRKYEPKCSHHICVLADTWTHNEFRTINQEQNNNFLVTEKMIQDLIARDQKKFQEDESVQEQFQGWGMVATGPVVVSSNGYRVATIHKHASKRIQLDYSIGLLPQAIAQVLITAYERAYHTDNVLFTKLSYAYHHLFPLHDTMTQLLVYPEGLSTTLGWSNQGIIRSLEKIPKGFADIHLALARSFEVYEPHVAQVLSLSQAEHFLEQDQDVYHKRIVQSYDSIKKDILAINTEQEKKLHTIPQSVIVLGAEGAHYVFAHLIAESLDKKLISTEFLFDHVLWAHDAHAKDIVLVLGIIESMRHVS